MVYTTTTTIQEMKARKRLLTCCVECQSSFRPHLWGRESGKGPVCDQCSTGDTTTEIYPQHQDNLMMDFSPSKTDENIICANCQATTTPLWRRDAAGKTICNACGLYYKLHHVHRPATMMRTVIKRRKRCPSSSSTEKKEKFQQQQQRKSPSPQRWTSPPPQRKLSFDDSNSSTTSSSSSSINSDLLDNQHHHHNLGWNNKLDNHSTHFTLPPIYTYYQQQQHCNHNKESLYSQRQELQKEVTRLSKLLSSTVARLSDIDSAMNEGCPCSSTNNDDSEVARSLLSLASPANNGIHLPPISVE